MKYLISLPKNSIPYFHNITGLSREDWFASSDPIGDKPGSGGGTANILAELWEQEDNSNFSYWLKKEKRVIIHSGGRGRRLRAYAPLGKSLLPLPVFRWSRGQHLNQRLIHPQHPLFDQIIEKAPENVNKWTRIHDQMFHATYLKGIGKDYKKQEIKAFELLREGILQPFKEKKVSPCINLISDQIAWGRSPVRFDIAGGWTDTPPYCNLYGGKVVNLAAELNGQLPLHCYIKATEKPEFIIRSIDLGSEEKITTFEELRSFQNIKSSFSIPKAALALAGFLPEFNKRQFSSLQKQLIHLGGGLEIAILSAVPKGSGLGTSSVLASTVLGTLAEVCGLKCCYVFRINPVPLYSLQDSAHTTNLHNK